MSKILVVDDDKDITNLLQLFFKKSGFETYVNHDGKNILEIIKTEKPDVILLDIQLPDISGVEILKKIRYVHQPVQLPIIMVTAMNDDTHIIEALRLGANDYISKPLNIEVALARINTQLTNAVLYRESLKAKELETLNAMIITYNHELNNPLSIALGSLRAALEKHDESAGKRLEAALWRIADTVKKINDATKTGVEYEEYAHENTMIKINKSEKS